jgi:hypothetical protein
MVDRWCYPVPQAMQRHTGSHLTSPAAAREAAPPTVPTSTPAPESAPPLPPSDAEAIRGTDAR